MEQTITVAPISNGWAIKSTAREREWLFRSGAEAETAAHGLGAEIAAAGDTAVIEIYLRDGTLGGRYVHASTARDWTPDVGAAGAALPGSPPAK